MVRVIGTCCQQQTDSMTRLAKFLDLEEIEYKYTKTGEVYILKKSGKSVSIKARAGDDPGYFNVEYKE